MRHLEHEHENSEQQDILLQMHPIANAENRLLIVIHHMKKRRARKKLNDKLN